MTTATATHRIREGEILCKADAEAAIGRTYLATLRQKFGLRRLGTNNRAFYEGGDIIASMRSHALDEHGTHSEVKINFWVAIVPELVARGLGVLPDTSGDSEPWLSYHAVAHLTGWKASTIERKSSGLQRHPLAPFIKLSHLERQVACEVCHAE